MKMASGRDASFPFGFSWSNEEVQIEIEENGSEIFRRGESRLCGLLDGGYLILCGESEHGLIAPTFCSKII